MSKIPEPTIKSRIIDAYFGLRIEIAHGGFPNARQGDRITIDGHLLVHGFNNPLGEHSELVPPMNLIGHYLVREVYWFEENQGREGEGLEGHIEFDDGPSEKPSTIYIEPIKFFDHAGQGDYRAPDGIPTLGETNLY